MSSADNTTKLDPVQQFERIAERAKKRRAAESLEQPHQIIQLKLWPSEFRAAPSSMLRSALFGLVKRGARRAMRDELLASWSGVELRYTGWQLDQADLDVWMQAVHQARDCLGDRLVLNERLFLRDLGRTEGGRDIKWLRSSLNRLQACGVHLTLGDLEYQGSLIHEFARDKRSGRYVVELNPRLADFFSENQHTLLQLEERRKLKTDLAKWLQGYVRSHRATRSKPHRIRIDTLRSLCGSQSKRLRDFRKKLCSAMDELKAAGVVATWTIISDGTVLKFNRPKTKSPDA